MRGSVLVLCTAFVSTIASAAPKPAAGSTHSPALYVDVSPEWVSISSREAKYGLGGWFRVYGVSAKDQMSIALRSGASVLSTGTCKTEFDASTSSRQGTCDLDKDVTAAGAVELDLLVRDDATDNMFLVTTLKLDVHKWPGPGKSVSWGITPDDLLALTFVRDWTVSSGRRTKLFEFWTTGSRSTSDATLRCTVGDKKLPDIDTSIDALHSTSIQAEISSSYVTQKGSHRFGYHHLELDPFSISWGPKDPKTADPAKVSAADNPGAWDCYLRQDGHKIREWLFTVDDQGMIKQSSMQTGKHPIPTPNGVVLIDTKIPKDNGIETRLRPNALKKSIGFGQAWPDGPGASALQGAFPPSLGAD